MRKIVIYEQPKAELPYVVAIFAEAGSQFLEAKNRLEARELAIRLRASDRTQSEIRS